MNENCFVADVRLFLALEARSTTHECRDSRTLFEQGESPQGLFLICDGDASLVMLSPDNTVIAGFKAGLGSVLGLPAVVGKVPYSLTATIHEDSTVKFVRSVDFEDILRESPSLYPAVLNLLACEVRSARAAIADLTADWSVGKNRVN